MNKYLVVLLLLIVTKLIGAQGISFEHGTFEQALNKAKKDNKLIFMDCYTDWCGPCKALAKNVFTQKEAGDFFNPKFVNVKMNMEKGEGKDLKTKYEVNAFPTLLFIDQNGDVLHKVVGGTDVNGLIQKAKDAMNPASRLGYYNNLYNEGKRDPEFIADYMNKLEEGNENEQLKKVGNEFINNASPEMLLSEEGALVLYYMGADYDTDRFKFIVDNRIPLAQFEGFKQKDFDEIIRRSVRRHLGEVANTLKWEQVKAEMAKCEKEYDYIKFFNLEKGLRKSYCVANKKFDEWYTLSVGKFDKKIAKDPEGVFFRMYQLFFNMLRNPVFEEAPQLYTQSIDYMEIFEEKKVGMPYVYNILASLYQKVEKKDAALKAINTYISLQNEKGEDITAQVLDLKKEIEKM